MFDLDKLVRPNIIKLKPYSSARDESEGLNDNALYLDANENAFSSEFNRYPDPHQQELKTLLAMQQNLTKENVFLGNGSDEAIDLLIRIFCIPGKDSICIMDPTYGMYKVCADINDVAVHKIPLDSDFQLDVDTVLSTINNKAKNIKLLFLCSPGNPTGVLLKTESIENILAESEIPVVVDEAYIDFSNQISFTQSLSKYENLVILQTFSKAQGLAGLRLGMAYASGPIIQIMDKTKPPYNINTFTQQRALESIKTRSMEQLVTQSNQEKFNLAKELGNLKIVEYVFPSDTNFILTKFKDSSSVFESLNELKILVRDRSKERYCENCLRITVGTPKENQKLINALTRYEKENSIY